MLRLGCKVGTFSGVEAMSEALNLDGALAIADAAKGIGDREIFALKVLAHEYRKLRRQVESLPSKGTDFLGRPIMEKRL